MAVSPDGNTVYLAIFESGNGTTLLNGGKESDCCEVDIVRDPRGPYGGIGIPPNNGNSYDPPINPDVRLPVAAPIIVRKNDDGRWMDDNNGDWTRFVSGDLSAIGGLKRGRIAGWDYPDRDVAIIDANTLAVSYQNRLMNTLMALAVHPTTGDVTVVGTEATNEIRWEPNLQSTFLRVNLARFVPGSESTIIDLNPHLDYSVRRVPQSQRNQSIGDPRGIVWNNAGTRAYITGMGSNNVIVINAGGDRIGRIEVGEGPTGIVLSENHRRAFVLNKFAASISEIDLDTEQEINRVAFFDPTPTVVKAGRSFLYDTHASSGLGHIACASCHIDGRTDRLAWDLGNPAGEMEPLPDTTIQGSPVKGPLLTMTLQDVVGHTLMHWRGDRADIGSFDHAFVSLQGADNPLSSTESSTFESFLATIAIPPNPNRNLDNSYATQVEIPGPNGTIARVGNAETGAEEFENDCRRCHDGDTTRSTVLHGPGPSSFAIGVIRAPTWRNFHERFGLWYQSVDGSNSGFGFQQDGGFDSTHNDTRSNDMMAFMLSVNGRFPYVPEGLTEETESRDTHAAVGKQVMLDSPSAQDATLTQLFSLADSGQIGLVAHGRIDGVKRGFIYIGNGLFQSDRASETLSAAALQAAISTNDGLIYTAVPAGSGTRIGVDRDSDGALNGDEIAQGTNPEDPTQTPGEPLCVSPANIAQSGTASQSSEYGGFPAANAIDGSRDNFTHTATGQSPASWSISLDDNYHIDSIVLHNRRNCCGSRLRDLTVYIFDETGEQAVFRSPFLNRHNRDNAPSSLTLDLITVTGAPVLGRHIQVVRTPDPELIGTNGFGNSDEPDVLSLAEVEIFGCAADIEPPPASNLVINGSFEQPVLTQIWQPLASVDGWSSGRAFELQSNGLFGGTAAEGNQWLELNAGGSGPWEISQNVATEAGRRYIFSFAYAARPNSGQNRATAQIGSEVLIELSGNVASGVNWQRVTRTFVATGASTVIRFRSVSGTTLGNLLDDVSLIPE